MESKFYTNFTEVKFIDRLKQNIDTCKSFSFSVSFIKKPGLRLLAPIIEAAITRGARGRLITSTYQNFTDIDSLQFFFGLQSDPGSVFLSPAQRMLSWFLWQCCRLPFQGLSL
ncbi:MAG: hypothetical protein K6C08_04585 [Oscillospiraceae bacterium]|nr:hypothetical protein [Oscillospiraceae bacterium]